MLLRHVTIDLDQVEDIQQRMKKVYVQHFGNQFTDDLEDVRTIISLAYEYLQNLKTPQVERLADQHHEPKWPVAIVAPPETSDTKEDHAHDPLGYGMEPEQGESKPSEIEVSDHTHGYDPPIASAGSAASPSAPPPPSSEAGARHESYEQYVASAPLPEGRTPASSTPFDPYTLTPTKHKRVWFDEWEVIVYRGATWDVYRTETNPVEQHGVITFKDKITNRDHYVPVVTTRVEVAYVGGVRYV